MTRGGYRWVLALVLSATFACQGDAGSPVTEVTSTVPEVTSPAVTEIGSVIGTWGLDSLNVDGEPMPLSSELARFEEFPHVVAWITFNEDGIVDGHLPCNAFRGEYKQRGSIVDWNVVKDASECVETEGIMEAEEPMTDLIWTPSVDIEIDEEERAMELAGSDVVMTFTRLYD